MNKIKAFWSRHRAKLSMGVMTAALMLPSAFAAGESVTPFDMTTVMGSATDNVVSSLQGIAGTVIPKGIVVLGIIIALRFGKSLIKSVTGGR